jgi:hypothetical protein
MEFPRHTLWGAHKIFRYRPSYTDERRMPGTVGITQNCRTIHISTNSPIYIDIRESITKAGIVWHDPHKGERKREKIFLQVQHKHKAHSIKRDSMCTPNIVFPSCILILLCQLNHKKSVCLSVKCSFSFNLVSFYLPARKVGSVSLNYTANTMKLCPNPLCVSTDNSEDEIFTKFCTLDTSECNASSSSSRGNNDQSVLRKIGSNLLYNLQANSRDYYRYHQFYCPKKYRVERKHKIKKRDLVKSEMPAIVAPSSGRMKY